MMIKNKQHRVATKEEYDLYVFLKEDNPYIFFPTGDSELDETHRFRASNKEDFTLAEYLISVDKFVELQKERRDRGK